jgi:beta-lactamase regulating signal transducer with metallopeptidase domain
MKIEHGVQQILVLGIFYILYQIAYRKKDMFHYNRWYLLLTLLISLIVPFITFDVFPYTVQILDQNKTNSAGQFYIKPEAHSSYLVIVYWLGVLIGLCLFVIQLMRIIKNIKGHSFEQNGKLKVAQTNSSSFSFFHFLFIEQDSEVIKTHETAHAYYRHSFDKVLVSLVSIFNWFNPFIHLYKYLLNENHECMADQYTMRKLQLTKGQYAETLLQYLATRQNSFQLTNNFSVQIKNRIIMLSQTQQQKNAYLFMLPIIALVFSAFTFKKYPVYASLPSYESVDTLVKPGQAVNNEKIKLAQIMRELDKIKLSGKVQPVIDTVETYNPETYEQKITVETYDLPIEINPNIYGDQFYFEIINKFATNRKKTSMSKAGTKSNK